MTNKLVMSPIWIIVVLAVVAFLVNFKITKEGIIGLLAAGGLAGCFFFFRDVQSIGGTGTPSFEVRTTLPDF
jgi:hypothetical protein